MRKLTQQEIEWAPAWADGYTIDVHGDIEWYTGNCYLVEHDNFFFKAEPIPRKEFDISDHDFSDSDVISVIYQGYETEAYLYFELSRDTNELCHSREDVIAMAKSMSLTAEDLK